MGLNMTFSGTKFCSAREKFSMTKKFSETKKFSVIYVMNVRLLDKRMCPATGMEKLASAVREASVSRHNKGSIKGSLQYDSAVMYGGFQGALNWAPVMPRDASLLDSCYVSDCCCFFRVWTS